MAVRGEIVLAQGLTVRQDGQTILLRDANELRRESVVLKRLVPPIYPRAEEVVPQPLFMLFGELRTDVKVWGAPVPTRVVARPPGLQARSQVGKRGGSKIINVDLKWAWITKRGWVGEGDVPPPARSVEAFENIDFATECKPICRHMYQYTHTAL